MTIVVIFFESALELIPNSHHKHPLVRKEWQRNVKKKHRGILLDGALHRPILDSLERAEKRGRPDIIHHSLMNVIYSPLFEEEKIQVFIHTRNDLCIRIPSNWRVPVNYNRFCGLFSQLLLNRRVPLAGEPILTVEQCALGKLLQEFNDSEIFLCDSPTEKSSKQFSIQTLSNLSLYSSKVFLIGGFQHGEAEFHSLESPISIQDWTVLKIYEEVKPAWVIAARLIHWLEFGDYQW